MNPSILLEISEREGIVVVSFRKKICLGSEAMTALHSEFGRLAGGSQLTVLLDCSQVEFLDPDSLKVILRLHRVLKKRGGSLTLCGLPPDLAEVFRITKLAQFLSVKESVEAARTGLHAQQDRPLPACPLCTWPMMGQCVVCATEFCEEHGSPRRRLCRKHRWIAWVPFVIFIVVLVFLWLMSKV
jgi:anti-anti-sigma factor